MANITKIVGKKGISFKITVTKGRDVNGKQIRYFMTWTPDHPMTERQMEKAAQKAAFEFEASIEKGFQLNHRQTFADYAAYVLDLKKQGGAKTRTLDRYEELLQRINPAIGHIKLAELRPQHLNEFYKNLAEAGIAHRSGKAAARVEDMTSLIAEKGLTRAALAKLSGVSPSTVSTVLKGKIVALETAEAVSKALGKSVKALFIIQHSASDRLSAKTILEHHRLIHSVLAQAEREMLVPFNAADKITPPKASKKQVNYLQPADVVLILDALESEPLKWRVITHLLLITGARRGEIMGLKWSRVDFQKCQIKIDTNLLYSARRGIYEDTPKTSTSARTVKLPIETINLLREYQEWYDDLRMKNDERWCNTDFLFVQDDGSAMNPDSITAWLRKFSTRHNLPHINPHAFRHTAASVLINQGADIVSVSKRLGHATTSTTLNVYAHIIEEADTVSSETLADVLLRNKKSKTG